MGHDFRPAYAELIQAIKLLGRPPILALTATATPAVMTEIMRELQMRQANDIHTGVYRDNLRFAVEQMTNQEDKRKRVVELACNEKGSGIIYCATVTECETLHAALVEAGVTAERYHGKLAASARSASQDAFMEDRARVMVATKAFGMGIDKPDMRFVIHAQMPGSLDAYYQEARRAGRDGEPARCTLLFELKDKQAQQFFLSGRYPSAQTIERVARTVRELANETAGMTLEKSPERLRKALPDVLHDIGTTRRTRYGGMKLIDEDGSKADATLGDASHGYVARAGRDRAVLERMISYAQSAQCRWSILLDYFAHNTDSSSDVHYAPPGDELGGKICGVCDNCLRPPEVIESPRELLEQVRKKEETMPAFERGERVLVRRYGQ